MAFMKSFCYTYLLIMIFAGSAAAHAAASALTGEHDANVLNAQISARIKKQASERIDASNGALVEQELEKSDALFHKIEVQRVAQLERGNKRHESEPLPIGNKKAAEENKACADCPELISIPGYKFAIGKFAVTFDEWDACVTGGGLWWIPASG